MDERAYNSSCRATTTYIFQKLYTLAEANLWAIELYRSKRISLKTIKSYMEHVHKYANWFEMEEIDWRDFPKVKSQRVLIRYRGFLIDARDSGDLSPSSTSARMRAVIRFYRYCHSRNLLNENNQNWIEKIAVIRLFDKYGFERTLERVTTDISIPNRSKMRLTPEDGLLPLTSSHMQELLRFTKENASPELDLMLTMGFFTGARIGSITTFRVHNLEHAVRDPIVSNMWVIPVGPGTGIDTKFGVSGDLLIPDELMNLIRQYAYSKRHLDRIIKATKDNKSLLFLTRQGKPFKPESIHREMVDLRRLAIVNGLKFMQNFKFHQTRATFGTWLMSISIQSSGPKSAIEFVQRAMHHKSASTTFRYITFLEHTKAKIEAANAFTNAFIGIHRVLQKADT